MKGDEIITKYSNQQLEELSISEVKKKLIEVSKGKIQPKISTNDKEPIWDGNIYIYNEEASESNEKMNIRIPVQVKAKRVSKFSRKFVSYSIEKTALEAYFNDGGVIYFVAEVLGKCDYTSEVKVFYKVLTAKEIREILKNIPAGGKTKSVHIDRVLEIGDKFLAQCRYFEEAKRLFSTDSIMNMIPLEKVLDKEIKIIAPTGVDDLLSGNFLAYCINDYNMKMPIDINMSYSKISVKEDQVIYIDDKRCFKDVRRVRDSEDTEYITFGDRLKLYDKDKKVTIERSKSHILDRRDTLEFFLNRLFDKNVKMKKKDCDTLEVFKKELLIIKDILMVCEKFKIEPTNVRLKNFKEEDFNALNILLNVGKYENYTDDAKSVSNIIVKFLDYKIALLKVVYEDGNKYYDWYDENLNLVVYSTYKDRKISFSRFSISDEKLLTAYNFNSDLVKSTLLPISTEDSEFISEQYTKFMLFLIKAWDIKHQEGYIEIINHLEDILNGHIDWDIKIINKAQVEYRLNNGIISQETMDELYKIKLNKDVTPRILCGILILLENFKGFEKEFDKLNKEEKEEFKEYPIYSLYSQSILSNVTVEIV